MRRSLYVLSFLIVVAASFLLIIYFDLLDVGYEQDLTEVDAPLLSSNQSYKEISFNKDTGIFSYVYEMTEKIMEDFGDPLRIDQTPYKYEWWIYDLDDSYIQFGVQDEQVITIFVTGKDIDREQEIIGRSYKQLKEDFQLNEEVSFQRGLSYYTFLLNEDDLQTQPLIKLGDDLYIICYIDRFEDQVISYRLMTGDLLTEQRFYEMQYRGSLAEEPDLLDEDWAEIERGMEQQIFTITNKYRNYYGVPSLHFDELLSEVALAHSKDMYKQNYFSHESLDGRGLKERIEEKNIHYLAAGENIAAQHSDAIAVVNGWLNSEGHREALLDEGYNYIGIGVYKLYYTQNFLLKP